MLPLEQTTLNRTRICPGPRVIVISGENVERDGDVRCYLAGDYVSFICCEPQSLEDAVEAVTTRFNNPSILCTGTGCGGGGGGGSCDATDRQNTIEYSEDWQVRILSAQAAADKYRPGDTVLITGRVQLYVTSIWVNLCDGSLTKVPGGGNGESEVFGVTVTVRDSWTGNVPAEVSGETFSATMQLPPSYEPTHTYTVTASFKDVGGVGTSLPGGITFSGGGSSDSKEVTVAEDPYAPTLVVKTSHEGFVYPGETIIVSGSGWAPNNEIDLEYEVPVAGQSGYPIIVDASGSFTAPPVTVPSDPPPHEAPYSISASEPTNGLDQSGSVVVLWRPLKVEVADPGSIIQGGLHNIEGTVTDPTNGDKPVDASVKFEVHYSMNGEITKYMAEKGYTRLPTPAPVTADGGRFISDLHASLKSAIGMYTITVTAEKPGYRTATVQVSVRVDEKPAPPVSPPDLPGAAAGGLGAIGFSPTPPKDYLPSEKSWDHTGKTSDPDFPVLDPDDAPREGGAEGKTVESPMTPNPFVAP